MKDLTIGLFRDRVSADEAVAELTDMGYEPRDISLITQDTVITPGDSKTEQVAGSTASGATTGALIGGIAGLLVGIGTIVIPGIGGLLVAGPIATALGLTGTAAATASGAVAGAAAGGLVGALVGLGIPEETAKLYEEQIKEGGIMVAVPSTLAGETREVSSVLSGCGATQVTQL